MYITHLANVPEESLKPGEDPAIAPGTVRWLIAETNGAPTFEMRCFTLRSGGSTPWHTHPWEHEVFVLSGKGFIRTEVGEHELGPGHAVLVSPGEMHQFRACEAGEFTFICVVPKGTRACSLDPSKR